MQAGPFQVYCMIEPLSDSIFILKISPSPSCSANEISLKPDNIYYHWLLIIECII